jgi:hypothetical protein
MKITLIKEFSMPGYKNLEAWKKSMQLVKEVYITGRIVSKTGTCMALVRRLKEQRFLYLQILQKGCGDNISVTQAIFTYCEGIFV